MTKISYKIKKKEFRDELMSLGDDEGTYSNWGRFIETDNKKLIEFFNEYLCIEHENFGTSKFCIGRYYDVADSYWNYGQSAEAYEKLFDALIKDAINNTGMYKGFGNSF